MTLSRAALETGAVPLTTGWTARPGIEGALEASRTPGAWQPVDITQSFAQQGFPDEGSVSYRLALRLPPTGTALRGMVQHANNAHRLWAVLPDGSHVLLGQSGRVADAPGDVVLSRKPVVFPLPPVSEMVLIWQISNMGYPRGGPFYPLLIGTETRLQQALAQLVARTAAMTGFFAALMLAALLFWLRDTRESAALAVALLAFLAALRVLILSGLTEHLVGLPFGSRVLLELTSVTLLPAAMALLLWTSMPWAFASLRTPWGTLSPLDAGTLDILQTGQHVRTLPPALRRVNTYATGLALAGSLLIAFVALFASTLLIGKLLVPAAVVFLLALATLVLLAVEVVYVRHPLCVLFSLAFLVLAAAGMHDLLVAGGGGLTRTYLLGYALVLFFVLFCSTYVLLRMRAAHLTEQANKVLRQRIEERSRELQHASRAAQAAYIAKGQFLASVSHELRTPLAAMLGYAHLLSEELDGLIQPHHHEFISTIEASGHRLLHLIDDLLDLARIEAGRFELRPAPVPANAIAREVCTHLYPLAREKDLSMEVETLLSDGADTLTTDGARLRQVLINLVSNAIKFTPAGSIRIRVSQTERAGQPFFRFSVSDTGVGIAPAFMPHLFEMFTQETQAYAQTQRGTGLGLHLSRELVERLGGTLEAESTVGEGSVFTVMLPR